MTKWATIALLLTTSGAYSEVVPIISGDQTNFPRFVATIPPGTIWNIQEEQGTSIIELPEGFRFVHKNPGTISAGGTLATLIERERPNQIEVNFQCNCRLDVYLYQDKFLVIDILNDIPVMNTEIDTIKDDFLIDIWWKRFLTQKPSNIEAGQLQSPVIQELKEIYIPERLARELSTAATSGRIELRRPSNADTEPSNAIVNDSQDSILALNIGIDTTGSDAQASDFIAPQKNCNTFSSSELFGSNVEDVDFRTLATTRQLVFSETGNPVDEKMISLALQYLEVGLEVEASQILNQVSIETDETNLLKHIAYLLEDETDAFDFWRSMQECENSNYLWYALSMKGVSEIDIKGDLVLLHFKALPRWLRQKITTRLHEMFTRNEEHSSAAEIISFSIITTEARLKDDETVFQDTSSTEIQIANRNQPELMLDILALSEHENATDISEAIRFEHQGTPLWFELLEAEILSLLNSKNYSDAISKLVEFRHKSALGNSVEDIANTVFSEISQNANDTDFLAAYFLSDNWPLAEDTLEMLSQRMNEFQIINRSEATKQTVTSPRDHVDEAIQFNSDATLDSSPPHVSPTLDSAKIHELLDDTQALRSSILSQLSSLD